VIFSLVLYICMYEKFKSMYYRKMIQKSHNSVEVEVFMNRRCFNVPDLQGGIVCKLHILLHIEVVTEKFQ